MAVEISELRRLADVARDQQDTSRARDYWAGVEDALRWAAGDANTPNGELLTMYASGVLGIPGG